MLCWFGRRAAGRWSRFWQDRVLFLSKQQTNKQKEQPRWVLQKYVHKIWKIISLVYIIIFRFSYDPWKYHQQKVWLTKQKVKQTGLFFKMNKLWRWYMYKKTLTLASRIFTIQFGDAILFAVHAVYEQGFRVSPVYALWSNMLRHVWRKNKQKTKMDAWFTWITSELKDKKTRSASCKHAACAHRRRISKSNFVRKKSSE